MSKLLYVARTDGLENDLRFEKLYHASSVDRQNKTDRLVFRKDKMLSLAGEALLRIALSDRGIRNFQLEYNKNGKPYIRDGNLFFNLSHSEDTVICAVFKTEIGADIEKITDIDLAIAENFFHPAEYALLAGQRTDAEKRNMFFRLWTLKESFMKAAGLGMELPTDSFCIEINNNEIAVRKEIHRKEYYFKEYDFNDGYQCAVCTLAPYVENQPEFVDFKEIL